MTAILIADDDADIRDLVAFKLEQAGFEVTAVDNGPAALSAARQKPPDLVVLDVMMPGMSGIDVCRELRAHGPTATLPVILLTARAQEADVATGFGVGADDYVIKPFSPRELVSRVEAVLGRSRTETRSDPEPKLKPGAKAKPGTKARTGPPARPRHGASR